MRLLYASLGKGNAFWEMENVKLNGAVSESGAVNENGDVRGCVSREMVICENDLETFYGEENV